VHVLLVRDRCAQHFIYACRRGALEQSPVELRSQNQGCAERAVHVRMLVGHELPGDHRLQVALDRSVAAHSACEHDASLRGSLPAEQRVNDVCRESMTQTVADRLERIALLLGMDEIGLGKYRTARGDLRSNSIRRERGSADGGAAVEAEATGLLIQEASGTGRAGAAASALLVAAVGREADQVELLAAHDEQGIE